MPQARVALNGTPTIVVPSGGSAANPQVAVIVNTHGTETIYLGTTDDVDDASDGLPVPAGGDFTWEDTGINDLYGVTDGTAVNVQVLRRF